MKSTRFAAAPPHWAPRRSTTAGLAAPMFFLFIWAATSSFAIAVFTLIGVAVLIAAGYVAFHINEIELPWLGRRGRQTDAGADLRKIVRKLPGLVVHGGRGEALIQPGVVVAGSAIGITRVVRRHGPAMFKEIIASHIDELIKQTSATTVPDVPRTVRWEIDETLPDGEYDVRAETPVNSTGGMNGTKIMESDEKLAARVEQTQIEQRTPSRLTLHTAGEHVSTSKPRAEAGRHPDCDLLLPSYPTLSRFVATFIREGDLWFVEPHGKNAVRLNGRVIEGRAVLADEDRLIWGASDDAPFSSVQIGA